MKSLRVLLMLLLVVAFGFAAYADEQPLFGREFGGQMIEKEIARPNDGGKNYLTVFGEVGFDVNKLKAAHPEAHFRHIHSNDPIVKEYLPYIGQLPCVLYTRNDGAVIHKASGRNVPANDSQLPRLISDCRPFRPQPDPAPVQPPVTPEPPVFTPAVVPDTVEPVGDSAPTLLYVLLAALGAAGGAGYGWYKEIKGE